MFRISLSRSQFEPRAFANETPRPETETVHPGFCHPPLKGSELTELQSTVQSGDTYYIYIYIDV